jgi:1,4-dihydroxy-2-naphthoate octaprenyltransferase
MGVAAGAGAVWWVAGARPRTLTAAMVTGGAGVLLGWHLFVQPPAG